MKNNWRDGPTEANQARQNDGRSGSEWTTAGTEVRAGMLVYDMFVAYGRSGCRLKGI